jgi:hypothetical protein
MLPLPDDRLRVTITIDPDNWVDPDSACKLVEVDRSFFVEVNRSEFARRDSAIYLKYVRVRDDKINAPNNEEALAA